MTQYDIASKVIMENCREELPRTQKADMLTSMAILSGLVSKTLPADLIKRRRDIMMESAAYDIIKEEGRNEVLFKQIEGRFGMLPVRLKNRVLMADSKMFDLFAQAMFDFQSLDEAEEWWKDKQ